MGDVGCRISDGMWRDGGLVSSVLPGVVGWWNRSEAGQGSRGGNHMRWLWLWVCWVCQVGWLWVFLRTLFQLSSVAWRWMVWMAYVCLGEGFLASRWLLPVVLVI